ncbi:unnamed protein product [Amoebophrya sp. A120]|nr:unnamed protein product [Amoebophrya sp. A120]|eukprot:GSA120T00023877001.1
MTADGNLPYYSALLYILNIEDSTTSSFVLSCCSFETAIELAANLVPLVWVCNFFWSSTSFATKPELRGEVREDTSNASATYYSYLM